MPRISQRRRVVQELEGLFLRTQVKDILNLVLDRQKEDDDTIDQVFTLAIRAGYFGVLSRRYLLPRGSYRGYCHRIFERDLYEDETGEQLPWLHCDEFLQKYRVKRGSFWRIVDLIKTHPVFNPERPTNKKQAPVAHQLMVFLHYIGTEGAGANNPRSRNVFGIGRGTCDLYRSRVVCAIRSLREHAIRWPDEAERKEIAKRIADKYSIPNCIAVADGTLFPLQYEPQTYDAPDYSGRKFPYSLSVMIVNDDQRFIRYYLSGFPGCAHDSRVYAATKLAKEPEKFFGDKYYLIADSAMENSPSCVSSFKAPRGHSLPEDHEKFNTVNGRLRVTSEHTIGILKGRFPWLRLIPMIITEEPASLKKILKVIDCCVILHNLLLSWRDEGPEEFVEQDIGDDDYYDDHLSTPITEDMRKDERRQRLLEFYKDFVF